MELFKKVTGVNIQIKFLLGFLLISIIPIIVIGFFNLSQARSEIQAEKINQLEVVADLKVDKINTFFDDLERDITTAQNLYSIQINLPILISHLNDRTNPQYLDAIKILNNQLIDYKDTNNYIDVLLFDTTGRLVYSTGYSHSESEYGTRLAGIPGETVLSARNSVQTSEIFKSPFAQSGFELLIAAPVHVNNQQIGFVAYGVDMKPVYDSIQDITGLGETGETTLGKSSGDHALFLNILRHDKDAALSRRVYYGAGDAIPMQEATKGINGSGLSIDYRGEPIVAAWRHIPERNWGIVAKIDQSEAFSPIFVLTLQTILVMIIVGLISIALALIISRSITNPIIQAKNIAIEIAAGNMGRKIENVGRDEIGQFSQAFNSMTEKLKNSYGKLSTNAEELEKTKVELERQQKALMNVLEDVSEEKALEETQSKSLVETIREGIVVTNDEGNIEYVNPAFVNKMNFDESELVGKSFADTMHGYDVNDKPLPAVSLSDAAAITKSKDESNVEKKVILESKDQKKIGFVVSAAPINVGGEFKGVVRVLHDVSEDLKLQQQKDDFFSIASHELRTPLTVIGGNLDTVLEGYGKSELSPEDKQLLQDAENSTDRLIKMVNDFLNVSRLDQGRLKYDIQKIDACALTEDLVRQMTPLAKKKNITLEYICGKDHPHVLADEGLLKEIVINLIGNALKFTSEGGITLKHSIKGDMLITAVIDTGMGIDKSKHDSLFQRFQQAMNRTLAREAGGTGLGLYISREFARKMGGDLKLIESTPGKGSTFELTIPLFKKSS